VGSPTKTEVADKPATIADLFSKCSELAAQEEKEMGRIMSTILPLLAWLNQPVALRPGSLGDAFSRFASVSLEPGATVVTTDFEGKVLARPLAKFRTKDCLAIFGEAFPELQKLVAEKKRAAQVKPALSMRASLGGARFILDMRTYRLLVSNSGGDCRGLSVSVQLSGDRTKACKPCDLNQGEWVEVDLGVYKEVSALERVKLRFDCKDVDGRELHGEQTIRLDGAAWQEAALRER
jgi:hypothetical protein